jgi:hypothetical protein
MLIEIKDETNKIDPQLLVNNNGATTLYIMSKQDTAKTSGEYALKRNVIEDILNDVIPPIE